MMGATGTTIAVHPLTQDPHAAWAQLKPHQNYERVSPPLRLDAPVRPDAVRFVCVSDTHNSIARMRHKIPPGDVLIHAGDFTRRGLITEVDEFNRFMAQLPHRHKLVIAGNHELSFDPATASHREGFVVGNFAHSTPQDVVQRAKRFLTHCTYLEDSQAVVYGIKVYGSPWQPRFYNWAFNESRGQPLLSIWDRIPEDTDVLVTHTPPVGHGDFCVYDRHVGCVELLGVVQRRVRPRYHVFGHIHEAHGVTTDGQTTFINASICDFKYRPVNPPILFDLPLPEGFSKDS
ncbi:unnamed protein product [Ixodes persulcatus]